MKRYIIPFLLIFATWQAANAMSYERAREEALYLTDKMAYELNLNDQQYNDAYEINLDYFLSLNSEADLYGDYLSYRLSDFRHILCDWQYSIMLAAEDGISLFILIIIMVTFIIATLLFIIVTEVGMDAFIIIMVIMQTDALHGMAACVEINQ